MNEKIKSNMEKESVLFSVLPEVSSNIMQHVKEHGCVIIGEMSMLLDVSRKTLKKHFNQITDKQYLVLYRAGRSSWYTLS